MTSAAARIALNNGTPGLAPAKPKRQRKASTPKAKTPAVHPWAANFKLGMTIALGVGIPLLSLAMSKLAGTLAANGQFALAGFAFALMVSVLGVSLNHLAWAIANITRSPWEASWALAVALDLSLVCCETIHVYADQLSLAWVCYAVISCVALTSMALNVWAFLMHE